MNWTREHTIVTLYLYCLIPFNKANNSNSEIKRIASILGRSINSVKMKIGNFGSFDPILKERGIVGLGGTSHLDENIWNEYQGKWDKLAIDAERIIAEYKGQEFVESAVNTLQEEQKDKKEDSQDEINSIINSLPKCETKEQIVKARINQYFFRKMVLSSYESRCCITGLSNSSLLEACHIVDWASNESERMNPCNGLCMSSTFHRAYDKNLIGISPEYKIHISDKFLCAFSKDSGCQALLSMNYVKSLNNSQIILPTRFMPDKSLLEIHWQHFKNQ